VGWLQQWDLLSYDFILTESLDDKDKNENIVIIAINESDIQSRKEWPLTDLSLSNLLEELLRHSPAAIGVDIYRDALIQPGSDKLKSILDDNANIFLVEKFSANETEIAVRPSSELVLDHQTGFSDIIIDSDGAVRRGLLFLNNNERFAYAISLRLALQYLATKNISLKPNPVNPDLMMLGDVTYKPLEKNDGGYRHIDASGYQYLLSYQDGYLGFKSYSMNEIMSQRFDANLLENKIVLIGVVSESVKDSFITPLSKKLKSSNATPGVYVHAHATSQLIRSATNAIKPLMVLTEFWENIWLVIFGLLGWGFALLSLSLIRYFSLLSIGLFSLFVVSFISFSSGIWFPIAAPILAFLGVYSLVSGFVYIQEKRERTMVMDLFARHVSQDVANEVWKQRGRIFENGRLKSQRTTATVLFTDLVGYTSTAEKLDADSLMSWLNEYMEIMANCVIRNGGMIDDYYGDAIKANFGIPIVRISEAQIEQDARNAVTCAMEMNAELEKMNVDRVKQDLEPIGMRIGIATGDIIAGSLGSSQRLKYTSIGDIVNIAARLESYGREFKDENKQQYCSILIAESTKQFLDDRFSTEVVGELLLKGKEEKLTAFQLMTKN